LTDPRDVPSNVATSQSNGFGNGVALAYDASSPSDTISINQGGISDSVTYSSKHLDNEAARERRVNCPCAGCITFPLIEAVASSMRPGQFVTGKWSPIWHLREDCKRLSRISAFGTEPNVCGCPQFPYPLRNQRRQELVKRRAVQLR